VDGSLRAWAKGPAEAEKLIAPYRGAGYRDAAARFVGAMFPNPDTEALRDRVLASVLRTPQHVLVGAFEGMLDPAIWKDDPIAVPLLVVNAKSPFWTADYEAYVRRLASDLEFHTLEGPGHFLMLERPEEFHALLRGFLEKKRLAGYRVGGGGPGWPKRTGNQMFQRRAPLAEVPH
jgi:pimeloyl-ACP methyl ester carboxylesterase